MKINIKKENIKMKVTPERSKLVQEICFGLDIYWCGDTYGSIQFEDKPYLFISWDVVNLEVCITFGDDYFSQNPYKEVSAEEFIKTKGFTENITEYEPKEVVPEDKPKDNKKGISKKILKKFIKRIKKEQKNKMFCEVVIYNKCADILKDIVLEVGKDKNKKKGD